MSFSTAHFVLFIALENTKIETSV